MRALGLVLLFTLWGCAFPRWDHLPVNPEHKGSQKSCQGIGGLELCLKVRSWDGKGLRVEVEARNTGVEVLLVDPAEFKCQATNPKGQAIIRWAMDPWGDWLPGFERDQGQRQLRKHSLAPGEVITGQVAFPLSEHRDAAFPFLRITATQENRDFAFEFRPDPFLHPNL